MKKFGIIVFNIFNIFIILLICELSTAYINYYSFKNFNVPSKERKNYKFIEHLKNNYNLKTPYTYDEFRVSSNGISMGGGKKGSIILMGCSFTYGIYINDNETFSWQLSKYTKRNVYNLGLPGGSPREMLDMFRTNKIYDFDIDKNNIEYVIYTYIWDHQIRLYSNLRPLVPNFKLTKDNKLIAQKIHWWDKTFFVTDFKRFKFFHFDKKHSFDLFIVYMKEINQEILKKLKYKNTPTKFIILVYYQPDGEELDFEKLNHENFKVIKVKDLIGKEISDDSNFRTFDNHPNAKAWQVIVPALAKELNL